MSGTKTAAMVRGAGMSADLVLKLVSAVSDRGGTEDDVHLLVTPEGEPIIGMFADHLVKVGAVRRNCYPVKKYYASLQAATVAGQYGYVNPHISAERFDIKDGEIVIDGQYVLYHPDYDIESEDAVKELGQLGLRPANLPELCAFGETHPDIQREFPVVALGSVGVFPDGSQVVACLGSWRERRYLFLFGWGGRWHRFCRFLAARKQL